MSFYLPAQNMPWTELEQKVNGFYVHGFNIIVLTCAKSHPSFFSLLPCSTVGGITSSDDAWRLFIPKYVIANVIKRVSVSKFTNSLHSLNFPRTIPLALLLRTRFILCVMDPMSFADSALKNAS